MRWRECLIASALSASARSGIAQNGISCDTRTDSGCEMPPNTILPGQFTWRHPRLAPRELSRSWRCYIDRIHRLRLILQAPQTFSSEVDDSRGLQFELPDRSGRPNVVKFYLLTKTSGSPDTGFARECVRVLTDDSVVGGNLHISPLSRPHLRRGP